MNIIVIYLPLSIITDHPSKIQKTDIGEPVAMDDPETGEIETGGVTESELTQSNEMLIN